MLTGKRTFLVVYVLAVLLPAAAQVPQRVVPFVPSHTEPAEGLAVRQFSPHTGFAAFAASTAGGILLRLEPSAPAEARAFNFLDAYGSAFGLPGGSSQMQVMRPPETDPLGFEHVRMQQFHKGVPVRGAEFQVHMKGARVLVANGHVLDDLPEDVTPTVAAAGAGETARQLIAKHRPESAEGAEYSEPRLEIFNRGLLSDPVAYRSRLAWFVEARGVALRELIWIDAEDGTILLNFSQVTEARSRRVYNGNYTSTLPGTLVRTEGGAASGNIDVDNAYAASGATYDYFLSNHGRDSYDGAGAQLHSTTDHCPSNFAQGSPCNGFQNAFWNGAQMVYADGWPAADDVVAHELTHAVTEYTANLFYYMQSGALNESFSDIFGETVDLLDGIGNDTAGVRWIAGEDVPVGPARNMMNPPAFGHPGKMSDSAYFYCGSADNGGVHLNSGIPNHAYALMVDGGTYNSTTITGIGLTKAAKVQYRALAVYLTSGSGFSDAYAALNQSCADLVGTAGITTGDCTQVNRALMAVEMNNRWGCSGATAAPPLCSSGIAVSAFSDTFETASGKWTATNATGGWNPGVIGFAKGGLLSAYGTDPGATSDHRLTMTNAVAIPAGARLYFDHAFDFEEGAWDGGVVEYSTNGTTWLDAGPLIEAGQAYNGTIFALDRSGFVNSSFGYTGTRMNLATLAGQNVRFRFRIGSDTIIGALGWLVDNVSIYTCTSVPTGDMTVVDATSDLGTVNVAAETSDVIGYSGVVLTDVAQTSNGVLWGIDFNSLYTLNPTTGLATFVGSLGAGGMNALVANGDGLLAASTNTTSLYSINTSTGAATALTGSLGLTSMGDLAFHGGNLYASVQNGPFSDLVRITLSGNSFTATNLGHVTSDNSLYGLAVGSDNNLYGFSNRTVLRINTSNPAASVLVVANYNATGGGLGNANGASSRVAATFTDHPLVAGSTRVRVIHITELRTRINAVRAARGLPAFSWTNATLTAGTSLIRAVHVTELRTALSQAYTAAGLTPPVFTDASLAGVLVKATHIMQLRAGVIALE